ncbi:unnamed protein product [Peniophora sp. CBMAI 1063]|nr:unnamed protein product [Peniophora sp. CBMAI 1063]
MPDSSLVFPVFSFLGFVLCLIPLPWHLHAWNSGTCYYMIWTAIACLNQFINSIIWHGNVLDVAPAWCEISTRVFLAAVIGIPASCLCINRRLYTIAHMQSVSVSHKEKCRNIMVDTFICVACPLLSLPLAYIVQGHRYDIYEDIGCFPVVYDTPPAFLLVYSWPLMLGVASGTYGALSMLAFWRRRAALQEFMSSNKALTRSRYARLIALSTTELCFNTPLAIWAIVWNATYLRVEPWVSWEDTHFNFGRVGQIPAVIWRAQTVTAVALEMDRWLFVFCAIVFFCFFGFAQEARKHYSDALHAVASRLVPSDLPRRLSSSWFRLRAPTVGRLRDESNSTAALPLYAPKPPLYAGQGQSPTSLSVFDKKKDASLPGSPTASTYSMATTDVTSAAPTMPSIPYTLPPAPPMPARF